MGRGLSPLQADIIQAANRYRKAVRGLNHDPRIYLPELFAELFGWEPRYRFRNAVGDFHWHRFFDPKEIGEAEYNSRRAAVSRAVKRLEQRGLIDVSCGVYLPNKKAIGLTATGIQEAERRADG